MDYSYEEKENLDANKVEELNSEIDTGRDNNEEGRFFGGRTEDVAYRHRFIHTACVCFNMFALGLRNALIGPTLPDLRLIIDEELSTASWIFTAKALGGLIGAVCGGFAYDRFNKIGVFVSFAFCAGVVAGVTPWCSHLAAMLIIHGLHGMLAAALETATMADMATIWKRNGPFLQAVQFAFSVGAIISPLFCEPFLAEQTLIKRNSLNSSMDTVSDWQLLTSTSDDKIIEINDTTRHTGMVFNTTLRIYGETRIYIPYSVVSLACLVSSFLFILVCFIYGSVYKIKLHGYSDRNRDFLGKRYFLSLKMKNIFTVLLALAQLCYVVTENSFTAFLMTFVVSKLNWSKTNGSTASSTFWIAFCIGRLSGIAIVKCVSLSAVIITFFSILASGAVLFLLAVIFAKNYLLWISVAVIGYGMSVIFSSLFSWFSQNIRTLTGKTASVLLVFTCIGNMGLPLLIGYLMDRISQMWFIYSCLALIGSMSVCFIFTLAVFSLLKKAHVSSETEVTINMK